MEARIEDDLHAAIHLGPGNGLGNDLAGHDGVDPGLQGLAGEVPPGQRQVAPNKPGGSRNGVRCGGLVQAGLLPEQGFEHLGRGAGGVGVDGGGGRASPPPGTGGGRRVGVAS